MRWRRQERGVAMLIALLLALGVMTAFFASQLAAVAALRQRDRASDRALAEAREALIAYAVDRPINAAVGPGYLPCPDLDDDGWAESTCGSLSGDSGQAERLGRLPWKTLGLADLRDGHGERLWYAVSTKYKGLLNCAGSRNCVDMTPPAALGTITVRDATGALVHDGTVGDPARARNGGAVAVVFAPGAPLLRAPSGASPEREQQRDCTPETCDANGRCTTDPPQRAAHCDPANFLDVLAGTEDNAGFVDRSDALGRTLNRDGFIAGPVAVDGRVVVNDRLAVVTYGDVMPRMMRRVALEAVHCLRFYASRPENAGRLPWPAAPCADPSSPWRDLAGASEGRIADTPFDDTLLSSGGAMQQRWWRTQARVPEALSELPLRDDACRFAIAPEDPGPARVRAPGTPADEGSTVAASPPSWWSAWKSFVTVAVAAGHGPDAATIGPACSAQSCLDIVARDGHVMSAGRMGAVAVRQRSASCAMPILACDAQGACRAGAALEDGDVIVAVQ